MMEYEFGKVCYINKPGSRLHKRKAVMIRQHMANTVEVFPEMKGTTEIVKN